MATLPTCRPLLIVPPAQLTHYVAVTAQLQHFDSLLRDEWERPLDVIIPSSVSQQYTLEAHHLRDIYSKCYVTDSAEIVV